MTATPGRAALQPGEIVYLYHWRFASGEEFGLYRHAEDAEAKAAEHVSEGLSEVLSMAVLDRPQVVAAQEPQATPGQTTRDLAAEEVTREFAGWYEAQAYPSHVVSRDDLADAFAAGMDAARDLAPDEQRQADLQAHVSGMGGPHPSQVGDDAAGIRDDFVQDRHADLDAGEFGGAMTDADYYDRIAMEDQ